MPPRLAGIATLNGQPIRASDWSGAEAPKVLTSGAALKPEHWPGGVPAMRRMYRPSLAYRMCLVAEGGADAILTLRPTWEWDIAAGALIAERAGAVVTDGSGARLVWGTSPPLTAGIAGRLTPASCRSCGAAEVARERSVHCGHFFRGNEIKDLRFRFYEALGIVPCAGRAAQGMKKPGRERRPGLILCVLKRQLFGRFGGTKRLDVSEGSALGRAA